MDKIQKEGVTAEELNKVVLNINKNREQSKHHNSYWMGVLNSYYRMGVNTDDAANFENIVNSLTPKDIQNFAKKLLKNPDILDIMFVPKK